MVAMIMFPLNKFREGLCAAYQRPIGLFVHLKDYKRSLAKGCLIFRKSPLTIHCVGLKIGGRSVCSDKG